jgi:uncharacterized SAM-binding protein YcdF (DUF218 family)
VSLLALSLPAVSGWLGTGLHRYPALSPEALPAAQAIVVLTGGRRPQAPEYGGQDRVSERAMTRAHYGAFLQRRTGLPILVTGGSVYDEGPAEALLMKTVLEDEFRVPVAWVEDRSRTTEESAALSAPILRAEGISRFLLVTEASHMERSVEAFRRQGLEPVPAPTRMAGPGKAPAVFDWIPTAKALMGSSEAVYAYLGQAWYRLRYR